MKLSCLPVSLYNDIFTRKCTVLDWIQLGSELGLDGVDFSIKFFSHGDAKTLNQTCDALQRYGITPCMLACYSDFTHPDSTQREAELRQLKSDIALAKELDAKFVRITAGQKHPGIRRTEAIQWVIEGFRLALDEADRHSITLAYENHTKGAPWQYWDFSQRTEIFLQIVDALSDTPLGICFDTANPLVLDEDVLALLDKVIERIVVLHIFDLRKVGVFEPVRVGTGASPIPQILARMIASNYDGWLSIEEASNLGHEGFTESIAFVKAAWQNALSA